MPKRLADYIVADSSFARSVNLRYDFLNAGQVERYVPTTKSAKVLSEILTSVLGNSPDRSRVVSGPYGSGKSAFALFLSALLRKETRLSSACNAPLRRLRNSDRETWKLAQAFLRSKHRFLVVVVNQDEEGLLRSLHKATCRALGEHASTRTESKKLARLLGAAKNLRSAEDLTTRIATLLTQLRKRRITGIFFICDEFGKFLERFALEPGSQELFSLQILSEFAGRQEHGAVHFLFLLHLSFGDYAQQLPLHVRNEWSKVEGRFRQVSFVEDSDQVYQLIAESLTSRSAERATLSNIRKKWVRKVAPRTSAIPAFKRTLSVGEWKDLFARTYPLHPVSLFALPRLSAKLGQNERTLYTYLAGKEPHSLVEFLESYDADEQKLPSVPIDSIFDYFSDFAVREVGGTLTSKRWAEVLNCLERTDPNDTEVRRLIKTIGALTILNAPRELPCSREVLEFALGENPDQPLRRLIESRLLVLRKHSGEYRLWQGSEIDFPAEIEKQKGFLRANFALEEFLQREVPPGAVAAQRYYEEYGTLRYFEGRYTSVPLLQKVQEQASKELAAGSDGFILYVICESIEEIQEATRVAELNGNPQMVFAIPTRPIPCRETALELAAIFALQADPAFIQSDPIARRELAELADICTHRLRTLLQEVTDPYQGSISWITNGGNRHDLVSLQQLKRLVSDLCLAVFPYTPRINNELINRRSLSSTTAAARNKLIAGLFRELGHPTVGLEGFGPEVAIFRSIFLRTGWYRRHAKAFAFGNPRPRTNLPRAMRAITKSLAQGGGKRTGAEILATLQSPPYGVRAGLAPLLLAVYLVSNRQTTAILENGIYVRDFGADVFERMLRTPNAFEFLAVELEGSAQDYVEFLRRDIKRRLNTRDISKDPIRNALALLYRWLHALPKFSLQTQRLAPQTLALRESLVTASDPVKLIFTEIPQALGFEGIGGDQKDLRRLSRATRKALDELADAYPRLTRESDQAIRKVFRLSTRGNTPSLLRNYLEALPENVEDFILDTNTMAFLRRARTSYDTPQAWLESVCSLITGTPMPSWSDADIKQFEVGLIQIQQNITAATQLCFDALQVGLRQTGRELVRIRMETTSGKVLDTVIPSAQVPGLLKELAGRVTAALGSREPSLFDQNFVAETVLEHLQTLVAELDTSEPRKPN